MPLRFLALLLGALLSACRVTPPTYAPITLADGLVVHDLVVPEGGAPVANGDTVSVHYDLRLENGSSVESSRETGQALSFLVGAGLVPTGLDRVVLGMRLYGRRELFVPGALAFGEQGRPPRIAPGAKVVFEIELIEHRPAPAPPGQT